MNSFVTVWLEFCTKYQTKSQTHSLLKTALSQESLVEGLRTNQPWAYRHLLDEYAANLLNYLLCIVRDQAEAEDLLQETFIKVWQNMAQYEVKKGGFNTWLLRITHNNAIDYIRAKKTLCSIDSAYQSDLPVYTPTYDYIGITELTTHHLSPNQQQVINLLYFQGYTMQEAAVHLNLPLGTVKTHSRSALRRFRPLFK